MKPVPRRFAAHVLEANSTTRLFHQLQASWPHVSHSPLVTQNVNFKKIFWCHRKNCICNRRFILHLWKRDSSSDSNKLQSKWQWGKFFRELEFSYSSLIGFKWRKSVGWMISLLRGSLRDYIVEAQFVERQIFLISLSKCPIWQKRWRL